MTSLANSDRPTRSPYSTATPGLAQGAIQSQHFYLYDPILEDRRMANTLAAIETRLMSLEIHGRIGRLGPLKSAKEMIKTAIKQGAKTVVVVGTDKSVVEAINATVGESITLGIIPIGRSPIAEYLSIPEGEAACDVVAARLLNWFDLGKVNQSLFIQQAVLQGNDLKIRGDSSWEISPEGAANISIINAGPIGSPGDGRLELVVNSGQSGWWQKKDNLSVVPFQTATASGADGAQILLDNSVTIKLPVTITIVPQALRVIVGKTSA